MTLHQLCIYCGKTANTKEHIPSKQFFKDKSDKPLITVPSCKVCNAGFQKDEDFFRQFYVSMLMARSSVAKKIMDGEISRSILRKPALGHKMFSQMKLIDAYTKSGLYKGKMTMYKVSDTDKIRIDRVVTKIIKGLFFHEFSTTLPEDWIIKIIWITPKVEQEQKLDVMAKQPFWRVIKEDTFAYWVNYVPKSFQSVWLLDFFKIPLFYVLVLDRKTAHEVK
ncbi:hypothetical protein FJZ40_01415 [Candidatus Shapirobacteria bacterium]|nr:hypothetical protein [Candidatus Shapirobacteria bacterium]MBM3283383.1 hypothetical protein [Candidatus Gottesmanbacteria bacterium]